MPQLDYIILADGVTNRPDGKIDIFGAAWDTIFASSVPALHPTLAISLRVLLTQQEAASPHHVEVHIMSPDGPVITSALGDAPPVSPEVLERLPAGDPVAYGAVLRFDGVVFPQYGRYHVALLWDGNQMREPMMLKVSPGAPPSPFASGS